jgi:hypothetical protein
VLILMLILVVLTVVRMVFLSTGLSFHRWHINPGTCRVNRHWHIALGQHARYLGCAVLCCAVLYWVCELGARLAAHLIFYGMLYSLGILHSIAKCNKHCCPTCGTRGH